MHVSVPTEKIIEAAARAGFDSELKVAAILSKAGWHVNQNVYFIDKDENKGRELDIEAYRIFNEIETKPETACIIQLLIEVKKTKDPFLFFSSTRRRFEPGMGFGNLHWSHNVTQGILSYDEIEKYKPLSTPKRIGRSYSAFKDGKTQQIAAGIISAFKSAVHFKEGCNERYSDESSDIAFFVPIMVVDGDIYDCYLDPSTYELTAEPTDALVYQQNYHSEAYGQLSSRVAVIRVSALLAYLNAYLVWGEHIAKTMKTNRKIAPGMPFG
jgi:hypothetical protein